MLLADWFAKLAADSGLHFDQGWSISGKRFTLGKPKAFQVVANFVEAPPYLTFTASDTGRQSIVDATAQKAADHVERGNLGGIVWYSTGFHELKLELFSSPSIMGSLLGRLSTQTRISGWRRLGSNILLEFCEDLPNDWDERKALLAPKAIVRVHIAAPGPRAGQFSSYLAHNLVDTIAAVCTFALGRIVTVPPVVFPSKAEALTALNGRQTDRAVMTLARRGVSLDIFSPLGSPGGRELFERLRAALLAFTAAARQDRDSVACILYVVAAEALTTPYTEWRRSKLTKRFVEFFEQLMPDELDGIVAHGNFEDIFGIRRGNRSARALRRELLYYIYDYRSGQLHQGLDPSYGGFMAASDTGGELRRMLFAAFAEGAILHYLAAPYVSLVGHPNFE